MSRPNKSIAYISLLKTALCRFILKQNNEIKYSNLPSPQNRIIVNYWQFLNMNLSKFKLSEKFCYY